jgi:hypothetical protein
MLKFVTAQYVSMNWVKCMYFESKCICVYVGVGMHEDMHKNLVGPFRWVKLRIEFGLSSIFSLLLFLLFLIQWLVNHKEQKGNQDKREEK